MKKKKTNRSTYISLCDTRFCFLSGLISGETKQKKNNKKKLKSRQNVFFFVYNNRNGVPLTTDGRCDRGPSWPIEN